MECGECERSVYAGHASHCSRRCQVIDDGDQCERGALHGGIHEVYDEDGTEVIRSWPARLNEPRRSDRLPDALDALTARGTAAAAALIAGVLPSDPDAYDYES